MNTGTQSPDQLFGCEVTDSNGNKIGKVDSVWVDDATNALEFIGVKVGMLMGKTHIIPVTQGQTGSGTITVPYAESQIKGAPSFSGDDELSPADEDQIYSYYGVDRSTGQSLSGLPAGEQTGRYTTTDTNARDYQTTDTNTRDYQSTDTNTRDYDTSRTGERGMKLSEEQLQVGKRQVESGRVRLRKVVHTERQEVPVELRRENVQVERTAATGTDVPDTAFQEQEIDVPLTREEPVVDKQARVTGEVQLNKTTETETRTVGGEVRSEDVEVVDDTNVRGKGKRKNR